MLQNSFIILPFSILHYNNPSTSTYQALIKYPIKIKTENGLEKLETIKISKEYTRWENYNTFYAFSPFIRPIPTSLKLFSVEETNSVITNIKYVYDPFNTQKNNVSFLIWNQPVPCTVALYLHITPSGDTYPSFNPNTPNNSWKQYKFSPIFVLVDTDSYDISNVDANGEPLPKWKKDIYGHPIFLFRKSDNRCIPDVNGVSIEQCLSRNKENILDQPLNIGPTSLLTRLRNGINKKKSFGNNINKFFRNISSYTIMITVLLFIISLISCIIILSNGKNKK